MSEPRTLKDEEITTVWARTRDRGVVMLADPDTADPDGSDTDGADSDTDTTDSDTDAQDS